MAEDHLDPRIDPEVTESFYVALENGDRQALEAGIATALGQMRPLQVAEFLIAPALNRLGDAWSDGRVALAQVFLAGRICEQQLASLLPDEEENRRNDAPRIGIAVLADRHGLGKRIVESFLRVAGYPVIDYGMGLDPEGLAAAARADDLEGLLVSTLMLPSALKVTRLVELLADHPVRIFVGGAPFVLDPELWRIVGADAMGHNASDALTLVAGLRKGSA